MTIKEWAKDFKLYVNALDIPKDDCNGIMEYIDDALALLKEQTDVPVDTKKQVLADRQCEVSPYHYERKGFCPKCHQEVKHVLNRNYCGFCGQAVKWE